jgi:single-strand DNA-binding protein
MAKGYSFAIVEGGLARDVESKALPSGAKVVNFSLGYERGFKNKSHTCWMNVVAFGTQAEFAEKYLSKGKSVRVYGEIDIRSYEDKQGQKKYITELIADKIQFVDSGSGGAKSGAAPARQASAPPARQQAAPQTRAEVDPFATDDDIPF